MTQVKRQFEADSVVSAATAGDERAFTVLVARHERELQAHAFRILGSRQDAEDVAQETFLRAWDKRESFQGRSSFRAWLYAIATNRSLTALQRRKDRPLRALPDPSEGDHPLGGIPAPDAPDDEVIAKETVELALLSSIHDMPAQQRAVLFMRDVLGWSAKDTAELLQTSVVAVNSALYRARTTLRELSTSREEWPRVA